ncbi:MAG: enoyl-CoA hydratase-related protein [Myxococcota bacterium]
MIPEPDSGAVITEYDDDIAVVTMDDGKANAMGLPLLDALAAAFDGVAASDARAVALLGRERFFSGGIDLRAYAHYDLEQRAEHARRLARTLLQVFTFRRPVVAGITGHAVAGGALLALAADVRLMARGEARLTANEVSLGVDVPDFGLVIARAALPHPHLLEMILHGRALGPDEAHGMGLVEEVVEPAVLPDRVRARARELGASVGHDAYEATKTRLRGADAKRALEALEGDIDGFIHRVHELAEKHGA